jgi:succinate dehydrogenase / fumarate reductase flavoprotein subunit
MQSNVGIVRIKAELEKALEDLEGLKKEAETMKAPGTSQYNPGWHEALSMRSLLTTSEIVARAALIREESRGAHTRLDHPGESEEWVQYNVIVKKGATGVEVEKRKRPDPPPLLKEIAHAKIEDLESGKVGKDA